MAPPPTLINWGDLEGQLLAATYRDTEPGPPVLSSAFEYNRQPPKASELLDSLPSYGLPSKIHRVPFYSNEEDMPEHPMRYAGRVFHIKGGIGVGALEHWQSGDEVAPVGELAKSVDVTGWEYAGVPPSSKAVKRWLDDAPSQGEVKKANTFKSQVRVYAFISGFVLPLNLPALV